MTYDASRKQNTNTRNFGQNSSGSVAQYNPVPYNIDFSLYLYVRNIEDGTQVIEHILPYFTPDYTIKLNMIPEMGIIKEVPVILNGVTQDITYEGDRSSDPRMIIWTLNFTVKANFYGPVSPVGLIKNSITNIYNDITPDEIISFTINTSTGIGSYQVGETVYQGYTIGTATATATVVSWDTTNHILRLNNIQGNFVSNRPIYGFVTNANYLFTSYDLPPQKWVTINSVPNPANANSTTPYIANTTITEYR